jgi:excisionase family DNA binding protein
MKIIANQSAKAAGGAAGAGESRCGFVGVSPQTVYLWVQRKQIPHLRVMGRKIRFLRSDLESFRAQTYPCGQPLMLTTSGPPGRRERRHLAQRPTLKPGKNVEQIIRHGHLQPAAALHYRGDRRHLGTGLHASHLQPVLFDRAPTDAWSFPRVRGLA